MSNHIDTCEDDRCLTMSLIMMPDKANFSGHVHGGYLMQLLDQVAYACAARYAGAYVVTLSADQILFKNPIMVGDMLHFYATVNYVGSSSMEIGIKVIAENLKSKERRHTNTCYFTMVALGENNKPTKVKPLELSTDLQRYRYKEAERRKKMRLEAQECHRQNKKQVRENGDN